MIVLPDVIPTAIRFLNGVTELTDLVADRISVDLIFDEDPAIRLDPIGGITIVEWRLDQQTLQVHVFASTTSQAKTIAHVARAAFATMVGYRDPGVLVVSDVDTSPPQLLPDDSRTPPIAHATFPATLTVRPDP